MDDDARRLIRRAEILANREWNSGRNELARKAERRGKRAREGEVKKLRRTGQRLITDYMFPDRNAWSDADAHRRGEIQRVRDRMLGWELLEKDKEDKLLMPPPDPRPPTEEYAARAKRRRKRIARAAERRRREEEPIEKDLFLTPSQQLIVTGDVPPPLKKKTYKKRRRPIKKEEDL